MSWTRVKNLELAVQQRVTIFDVEKDLALRGVEWHWVHLNTEGGDVLLLELSSQMSLDEGGLADTSISDEHELEFRNWSLGFHSTRPK